MGPEVLITVAVSGKIKKHPTSGKLLLTPSRILRKCGCCDAVCEFAIQAFPCWQTVDEHCEPGDPVGIWFCADSKCAGSDTTIGLAKTVTILWEGVCYKTDPDSIKLVADLSPEELALLVPGVHLDLDCSHECTDAECGSIPDVCACLCRCDDVDPAKSCCMSRLVWFTDHYEAPWWLEFIGHTENFVRRVNHGMTSGGGCVEDDCYNNRECVFFRANRRIKPEDADTLAHQACSKSFTMQEQILVDKRGGTLQGCPGYPFAYCGMANAGSETWADSVTIDVGAPCKIPYSFTTTTDTRGTDPTTGYPTGSLITVEEEGTCDFYQRTETEENWGFAATNGGYCTEYQKQVDFVRFDYHRSSDALTRGLCAQCETI